MANLWKRLFSPSDEISRYSLSEYIRKRVDALENNPFAFSYDTPTASYRGRYVEKVEDSYASLASYAYRGDSVVAACMRVRRDLFRQAKFCWREVDEAGPGKIFRTDELSLLDKPWPNGTTGELLARMITDVDLCGNSFIHHNGDRLRWLRPDWTSIVLSGDPQEDADVDVLGYVYTPGGTDAEKNGVAYKPDEICHWAPEQDPLAFYRGMSWVSKALEEVQGDRAATTHKMAFFRNGATLGPIVRVPAGTTMAQFKEFMAAADEAHAGAANAYKTMYLGGGAEVTLAAADFRQLDLKSVQGGMETRIAAVAGVHPVLVGLSEGLAGSSLNSGNFAAARRATAEMTLYSLWQDACGALQAFFDVPKDSELWIRERDIPFLREEARDRAEIFKTQVLAIEAAMRAGFKPDPAVQATLEERLDLLIGNHTGLFSVQMQAPGATDSNGDGRPDSGGAPAAPAEPIDFGALRADLWIYADDEIERAVEEAFGELDELDRARYDVRVPKGFEGGGRFRKLSDRLVALLNDWAKGEGDDDPLDEYSRDQLRRVAKELADKARADGNEERAVRLTPRRGASSDEIKLALYKDVRAHVREGRDAKAEAPKRQAKFTGEGEKLHDVDVAVYRLPGDKPALYRENDAGKRGRLVKKFDSLDDMAQWADDNGEPRVAQWARGEAGGKAPGVAPPTPVDEAAAALSSVSTRDEGRAALEGMPLADLRALAKRLDVDGARLNKADLREALVEATVGVRADARGIREGGWQTGRFRPGLPPEGAGPALSMYSPTEAAKLNPDLDMTVPESRDVIDAEARRRVETVLDDVDEMLAGDASDKALLSRLDGRRKLGAPASVVDELTAAVHQDEVENRIRAAYASFQLGRGQWVGLADLRDKIGSDVPREDVDAALKRLAMERGVHIAPVDMGSTFPWSLKKLPLTKRDHDAALDFGASPKHMIRLDATADPSPRRDRVRQVSADIRGRLGGAGGAPRRADLTAMASGLGGRDAFAHEGRNFLDEARRDLDAGMSPAATADRLQERGQALALAGPFDANGRMEPEREALVRRIDQLALKLRTSDPQVQKRGADRAEARRRFEEIQKTAGTSFRWGTVRGEGAASSARDRWLRGDDSKEIAANLRQDAADLERLGAEGRLTSDRIDMTGVLAHDQDARNRSAIADAKGLRRLADAIDKAEPLHPAPSSTPAKKAPSRAAAKAADPFSGSPAHKKRLRNMLATVDRGDYPGRGNADVEDLAALKSSGLIEQHADSPHGWRLTDSGRAALNPPSTAPAKVAKPTVDEATFDPTTLDGLTIRQKRARLKAMGFSAAYIDEIAPTLAMQRKAAVKRSADPDPDISVDDEVDDEPVDEMDLALEHYTEDDVERAAGHDVTPGHDELHHYWTRGEGLARWVGSPKPWTTLVALLSEHVPPEKAKVFASRWFIEVFGFAAGSDMNRVTHGKPPRGHVVGPG